MKLKTKYLTIERLIEFGKSKKSSSDSYIFLSTEEMLDHIQLSLDTFCPKLKAGITIDCLIEKVHEEYKFGILLLIIPKKLVNIAELEKFVSIENKIPFVLIEDSLDYKNKDDLLWFLEKIDGKIIPKKDLKILEYTDKVHQDNETGTSTHKVIFEPFKCRPISAALTNRAQDLMFKQNIQEAYKFARIAGILDPENFLAEQVLGIIAKFVHDIPLAIKHFENVKKINPNFYSGRKMLAITYFVYNEYEKSLSELESIDVSSRLDIEKFDWHISCAKAKMMLGFHDDAIQHLKQAESFSPPEIPMNDQLWTLYLWWGQACFMVQDYKGMIYPLKRILSKEPSSLTTWNNLGYCYAQIGNKDEALNCYQKANDLDENEINSLMNLSIAFEEKREYPKALTYLKKAKLNVKQLPEAEPIIDKHIEYVQKMVDKSTGIIENSSIVSMQELIEQIVNKNLKEKLGSEIPQSISSDKLNEVFFKTRQLLQQFIRRKCDSKIDLLKKDFPDIYQKAQKIMVSAQSSGIKRKESDDIFDYLDFGDFPYIIKTKKWINSNDIMNNLYNLNNFRRTRAHFDGPEMGELDSIDANSCYYQCLQVIRYFENLEKS